MNHTADRIINRMAELKVTQADIRRATGAGKATISSWIKGDTKPSGMYATKLASFLQCDTDWLLAGSKGTDNLYKAHDLLSIEEVKETMIPVIHWDIADSHSETLTISDIISWLPRQQHLSKNAFGLVIQGRSMLPEFKPDDIIYVEPEILLADLKDGDLIIINLHGDNQITFKEVIVGVSKDDMYFKTINPDWPDQEMLRMEECSLVGIVDSKLTKYR